MFQEFQRQSTYNFSWNFEIWYSSLSKVSTKIAKISFSKHQVFFCKMASHKIDFWGMQSMSDAFWTKKKNAVFILRYQTCIYSLLGQKEPQKMSELYKSIWNAGLTYLSIFPWTTTNNQSLKVWYETSFPEFWRWIVILSYYPRGEILSCNTIFLAYDSIAK